MVSTLFLVPFFVSLRIPIPLHLVVFTLNCLHLRELPLSRHHRAFPPLVRPQTQYKLFFILAHPFFHLGPRKNRDRLSGKKHTHIKVLFSFGYLRSVQGSRAIWIFHKICKETTEWVMSLSPDLSFLTDYPIFLFILFNAKFHFWWYPAFCLRTYLTGKKYPVCFVWINKTITREDFRAYLSGSALVSFGKMPIKYSNMLRFGKVSFYLVVFFIRVFQTFLSFLFSIDVSIQRGGLSLRW